MGQLQGAYLNGEPADAILQYEARLAAVTPADVQAAAKRYFDFDNYVQVVLNPETRPAETKEPAPKSAGL